MFSRIAVNAVKYLQTTPSKIPYTMKITSEQLSMVLRPAVVQLSSLFAKHGYELRVAGGAVRDLLRGMHPHDLDFATTATPDEMKKMFTEAGVRMLNTTGEKHGTITARIEEENFECTTLRIDIRTDGRRAVVEFTKDWYLDANRRDLTINSMFLGMDGTVYDYFNGREDLDNNKVVFVGDVDTRIKEDYLRILRYFRFYGRVAKEPNLHSQEVLDGITRNAAGLVQISGERIWSELQKIVVGNYGDNLLAKMIECKLGPHIGLDDFDATSCVRLFARCSSCGLDPHKLQPMTILSAGFRNKDEANSFITRVKCSRKERELLLFIIQNRERVIETKDIKVVQDLLVDMLFLQIVNKNLAISFINELLHFTCQVDLLKEFQDWQVPSFPIRGGMLVDKVENRKKIKFVTKQLFVQWKESNFSLTSEQLLQNVNQIKII